MCPSGFLEAWLVARLPEREREFRRRVAAAGVEEDAAGEEEVEVEEDARE